MVYSNDSNAFEVTPDPSTFLRHSWTPKEEDIGYLGEDIYLFVYTGVVAGIFFLTKARAISFFLFCMRISVQVHNKMFQSLVRAPIKFFDDNPSGNKLLIN
jgi:ABC-type multidrug transport system fused ATPase/permease subunit